jgi:hypothetical protein
MSVIPRGWLALLLRVMRGAALRVPTRHVVRLCLLGLWRLQSPLRWQGSIILLRGVSVTTALLGTLGRVARIWLL